MKNTAAFSWCDVTASTDELVVARLIVIYLGCPFQRERLRASMLEDIPKDSKYMAEKVRYELGLLVSDRRWILVSN